MNIDDCIAARANQLLQTQRLLQDAQRQLLTLPDAKPDNKEVVKMVQCMLEECNYTLHKCDHDWKLLEPLQHLPVQVPVLQQQQQQQ
jgi:hypothetical protein